MTQADRYDLLHEYLHNKKLDGSYQAAMYILSSSEDMTEEILPYVSWNGIFFDKFIEEVKFTGPEVEMIALAHNLFKGKTENPPTPYDLATLGYPLTEIALEAIYIASGLHEVVIEYDKDHSPVLNINANKQQKARKVHEGMKAFLDSQR